MLERARRQSKGFGAILRGKTLTFTSHLKCKKRKTDGGLDLIFWSSKRGHHKVKKEEASKDVHFRLD